MTDYYDYIILTVTNPAFSDNVSVMIQNGLEAGGTSPTIKIKTIILDDTDPENIITVTKPVQEPMVGTKVATGRIMLHFRLPGRYEEAELITLLESGMSGPKPPLSVESIISSQNIIYIDEGPDENGDPVGHYGREVIVPTSKARFLPYMNDISDGSGSTRPPNNSDQLFLSGYYGSDNIEL